MLEDSQDGMDSGSLTPGSARQVCIQRHPSHGFGFIAGSERPVVVRSVSAGKTCVSVWSYGTGVCCPLTLVYQAFDSSDLDESNQMGIQILEVYD